MRGAIGGFPSPRRVLAVGVTTAVLHDPILDALEALCVRVATAEAATGRIVWRSGGFAAALPNVETLAEPSDAVSGLAEAFADARLAAGPISALITVRGRKAVFDARLAPSPDRAHVHVELRDAAERRADERRRLEDREKLLLTSRVLSVGEMASMLAHELNQPIGSVVNLLRGLKAKLARGALDAEGGAAAIDRGIDQALYASGVIARIRTFVDQRQPQVAPLDLATLARDTLALLDWEIQRDLITAEPPAAGDVPPVLGDAVMIQQVLVNLSRNAIEAMRGRPDPRHLTLSAKGGAKEVEVRVQDTGPGIEDKAAARLFQPFNSTKADGMGVGLGVCRSIVELHGGRLWHSSPSEGGSIFHLALPRAAA